MAELEYAPDNIPTPELRFVAEVVSVFPKDEVEFPGSHTSLIATSIRYGRVYAANANTVKVFDTSSLLSGSNAVVTTLDTGAPVTHLICGSDGLTLMVVVIKADTPHALFYDVRAFVQGCSNITPFLGTPLSNIAGCRIMGMAWNPMDPACLAVASSSGDLSIVTLKDNSVEFNERKNIRACAVGWSSKGKQLTVGLQDGSLSLFKPDLTPVRTILSPPQDNIGSVLSINWFTNTEFFIGYSLKGEDGGHVMMYVNAPKGKAPRFVSNEYLCTQIDNTSPRPAMLYPTWITEWSVLLVLSSRAVMLGVLGSAGEQPGNWCEWDIDEGAQALLQNVNLTEETFALGVAVDLTSQKTFAQKTGDILGPCPVIMALSTGGELNMFHASYTKKGASLQTAAMESVPKTGLRTAQQYNYVHSVAPIVSTLAPAAVLPATAAATTITASATPASASTTLPPISTFAKNSPFSFSSVAAKPQDGSAKPFSFPMPSSGSLFGSSIPAATSSISSSTPTTAAATPASAAATASNGTPKLNFNFNLPSGTQISQTSVAGTGVSSALPTFSASSLPKFDTSKGASTTPSLFSNLGTSLGNLAAASGGPLPAASPAAGSISQGTPATPITHATTTAAAAAITPASITATPIAMASSKSQISPINGTSSSGSVPQTSTPAKVTPTKPAPQVAQPKTDPATVQRQISARGAEDEALLSTISSTMAEFEADLNHHVQMVDSTKFEVGPMSGMGSIRSSLSAESEWIQQMCSTTQELSSEVSTLHSAVLEGFTLLEEADLQMNKVNNPRHHNLLSSRPLDPYSRRKLEEIRALYQYLQSQLEEVNTKLDLDWAQHNDRINKKKSFEVPSSEMLYRALMNCHNLRRICEQQMDHLTQRLKKLQITSCVSSARLNNADDGAMLNRLEKSLMDTSLNSSVVSPVKAMSPAKLKNLNQFLSNRTTVPVRSTSKNAPKLSYNGIEERLDRRLSAVKAVDMSFDIPSKDSSFGPANFSTPNREAVPKRGLLRDALGVTASPAMPQGGFLVRSNDVNEGATLEINSVPKEVPIPSSKSQLESAAKDSASMDLPKLSSSGFSFGSKLSEAAKETVTEPATKTQFEDITPPETPDTKPVLSSVCSDTNPLSALSSLVSKVPSTTATMQSSNTSLTINGSSGSLGIPKSATTQPSDSTSTFSFKAQPASENGSAGFSFKLGGSSNNETSGLFGAKTESTSTDTSTFSFKTATSTSSGGLFGSLGASTPASSSSIFSVSTTSAGGLFGSSGLTGFPKTDSAAVPSTTVAASVFGSKSSSMFSSISATTTTITFSGSSSLVTAATSTSVTSTTTSILSTPIISSSTSSSIFGQGTTSLSSSGLFGSLAKSGSGGSLFGGVASTSDATKDSKAEATKSDTPAVVTECNEPKVADTAEAEQATTAEADTPLVDDNSKPTDSESVATESVSDQAPDKTPITILIGSEDDTKPSATTTVSGGLFGSGSAFTITTSSSGGLFGSSSSSLFGASTSSVKSSGLFGSTNSNSPSGGLFGSISTGSGLFGSTTTTSTASSSLFGIKTTSADEKNSISSSGSMFGAGATTTASSGIFGGNSSTDTSSSTSGGGLFGTTTTTSATPGLFGATTTASTTTTTTSASTSSLFGTVSASNTQSSSLFGTVPSTTSSASVFGSTATPTQSSTGIFGGSSTASGSIFGISAAGTTPTATTTPTTSSGSIFSSNAASGGGMFGASTNGESTGSVFGGASAAAPSSGSTFGTVTTSATGSLFGGTSTSGGVFGSTTPTSGASVFGSASTSTSGSSVFGNSSASNTSTGPFGTTSTFGQPVSSSSSVFGQNSNTATTSGSIFGQNSNAGGSSVFGNSSGTGMFGGSSSGFGSGSGGGFLSGLGSKPADSNEVKPFSAFGGKPLSEAKPQTGLFGSGGSTAFGAASPASPAAPTASVFGASGTATSPSSGFGASPAFGGSATFGGGPTFGGSPGFGGTSPSKFGGATTFGGGASFGGGSTFGAGATFGGGAAFGSSPPFGSSSGAGPFGSGATTPPTTTAGVFGGAADNSGGGFTSFASAPNTATFGGLANANNTPIGGNTFGGNTSSSSFTSWR